MADLDKTKRPASQYYWGDWWKDKGLHSCSLTARGLWHEMNCLMHEGEPYGHLTLNGRPMTVAQLANQCRITPTVCKKLLDELMAAGVPSTDESGVIFSRRMVRDEALREAKAEIGRKNGIKGKEFGAMGAEHGGKGGRPTRGKNPAETPPPTPGSEPPQNPPPSSSSSSSSSTSLEEPPSGVSGGAKRASKKCPGDFEVTAELASWASEKVPGLNVDYETEKFRDYTFATARTDWPATWRQWMRKAHESTAGNVLPINPARRV